MSRATVPRRRQRPPAAAVAGRLLITAGLREPVIRVSGHPRMRQRAAEVLDHRHRREQMITVSLLVLMLLGLGTWTLLRSPLLWVESVDVVGLDRAAADEIVAAAAIGDQQNVLDVDLERIRRDVAVLPQVDEVSVRRIMPSTIEIRVQQREAVLAAVNGGTVYLLDAAGVVIAEQQSAVPDLPVLALDHPLTVGLDVSTEPAGTIARVADAMPAGLRPWVMGYQPGAVPGEVDAQMRVPTDGGAVDLTVHLGRAEHIPEKAQVLASLAREVLAGPIRPVGFDVRIPDHPAVLTAG